MNIDTILSLIFGCISCICSIISTICTVISTKNKKYTDEIKKEIIQQKFEIQQNIMGINANTISQTNVNYGISISNLYVVPPGQINNELNNLYNKEKK